MTEVLNETGPVDAPVDVPNEEISTSSQEFKGSSFGEALEILKSGGCVTRLGWNGKGMYLELQTPDENSKMTRPYIYMNIPKGATKQFGEEAKELDRIPWTCSQTDMLTEDWALLTD